MDSELDAVMAKAAKAVEALSRHADVVAAFLFGSQAEDRADEHSDIDIAAFVRGADEWRLMQRARVASGVQAEVGDDIELHFFSDAQLTDCHPASFAAYVQKHGVRVDVPVGGRVAEKQAGYTDEAPDS